MSANVWRGALLLAALLAVPDSADVPAVPAVPAEPAERTAC